MIDSNTRLGFLAWPGFLEYENSLIQENETNG